MSRYMHTFKIHAHVQDTCTPSRYIAYISRHIHALSGHIVKIHAHTFKIHAHTFKIHSIYFKIHTCIIKTHSHMPRYIQTFKIHAHNFKIHIISFKTHSTLSRYIASLSQYRIRFSTLVNKKLLLKVSTDFRNWIHSSDDQTEDKLRLVRSLTSENGNETEMLSEARFRVGAALVAYAKGNPSVQTVKPYGLKAGRSTRAFKQLPTTTLSLTYAALYQVLRTDPVMLTKWIKTPRQNITQPWPRGMIQRFIKLQEVFEKNRSYVFKAYEDGGGEYMGEESVDDNDIKDGTTKMRVQDFEEDFD